MICCWPVTVCKNQNRTPGLPEITVWFFMEFRQGLMCVKKRNALGLAWLCTSQGLVMADRSQAVIIMALMKKRKIIKLGKNTKRAVLQKKKKRINILTAHIMTSFLVGSAVMYLTASSSLCICSQASTIFWNMVLFLERMQLCISFCTEKDLQCALFIVCSHSALGCLPSRGREPGYRAGSSDCLWHRQG